MIELDLHVGWFVLGGLALLGMTTLPARFESRPLSLPIVYVAVGWLMFSLFGDLRGPAPVANATDAIIAEYVTELVVIVSLAGAGLKLDRAMGLVSWGSVWRLLSICMVLTVGAAIVLGHTVLGLGAAAAVLLGAVVAPTDPVLADDVQVSEPGNDSSEVKFTLTAEAGLNDGLAFPISYLAVALAAAGGSFSAVVGDWVAVDVLYRIVVGVGLGWLLGKVIVWFARWSGQAYAESPSAGLFVLGATIVVYGFTELFNGYGFLAVFVAALTRDKNSEFREHVSGLADELEKMLVAFVLLGFGALLSQGILDALTWRGALVAVVLVLVVRPLAGLAALIGSPLPRAERVAVAFFGIRGMGSLYYLAWAGNNPDFVSDELASVWAVTSFAIVVSIVVHGVTASPAMDYVHRCHNEAGLWLSDRRLLRS